jgi:hypothetical protein
MSPPKKKTGNRIETDEAIRNLLIVQLLKEGIDPKILEAATGIPEKTIRGRFPMKTVRKKGAPKRNE